MENNKFVCVWFKEVVYVFLKEILEVLYKLGVFVGVVLLLFVMYVVVVKYLVINL